MIYDFEEYLSNIESTIKSKLDAKLTQIETEKGDGITIPRPVSSAYFMQSLDDRAANFDPFIVYGVQSIDTGNDQQFGSLSEKMTVYIIVIMSDNGTPEIVKKLFRYQKAFKQIFKENFTDNNIGNRIKIRSLEPVDFESLDSTSQFKGIGILIESFIA